jgi:hypothetical protein
MFITDLLEVASGGVAYIGLSTLYNKLRKPVKPFMDDSVQRDVLKMLESAQTEADHLKKEVGELKLALTDSKVDAFGDVLPLSVKIAALEKEVKTLKDRPITKYTWAQYFKEYSVKKAEERKNKKRNKKKGALLVEEKVRHCLCSECQSVFSFTGKDTYKDNIGTIRINCPCCNYAHRSSDYKGG